MGYMAFNNDIKIAMKFQGGIQICMIVLGSVF